VKMSILHLTLCSALVAVASAADDTCWYTDPPAVCEHSPVLDTAISIDRNDYSTLTDQMGFCQEKCVEQSGSTVDANGVTLPKCKHFSVRPLGPRATMCYLMEDCVKNTVDECLENPLEDGLCGGGRGDCSEATGCPALVQPAGEEILWVCDHVDNPYDADKEILEGTDCVLSCEGWVLPGVAEADDTAITVFSTCINTDGAGTMGWTVPEIMQDGISQADVPALTDVTLPKPDGSDQITCGCGDMDMAWDPLGENIVYDPNQMPGTTFICQNGEYLVGEAPGTEFKITEDMTCRLYCDGYHVATIECLNGQWTGQPELGAWCYYEPAAGDDVNTGGAATTAATPTP